MKSVRVGRNNRKIRVEGEDCEDWMCVEMGESNYSYIYVIHPPPPQNKSCSCAYNYAVNLRAHFSRPSFPAFLNDVIVYKAGKEDLYLYFLSLP